MTRTQIYLPDDQHMALLRIAKSQKTSLSSLIRQGAQIVIQNKTGTSSPQAQALNFLNSYSKKKLPKLPQDSVTLVRQERD
jgi:hypothetical protein